LLWSQSPDPWREVSYLQIKMCKCVVYGGLGCSFIWYDISLYFFYWERASFLFFSVFSWTFICVRLWILILPSPLLCLIF
jgi:hypothetical protein